LKSLHSILITNPIFSLLLTGLILAGGLATSPLSPEFLPDSIKSPIPVDAIPNLGENQQIVFSVWEGQSPEDVEDQVTYPLSSQLMGIDGVKTVRTVSMFGFSTIYLIFQETKSFAEARAKILEKLSSLPQNLIPSGVKPALGPDATALGQVYQYAIRPKGDHGTIPFSLQEISRLQEFQIRYELLAVEGVSEVSSIGVRKGEYQVTADPLRMQKYQISLMELQKALSQVGKNISVRTLEYNGVEYFVRGVGQAISLEDIKKTLVKRVNGQPIFISDLASVQIVPEAIRGYLDWNGEQAVGGIVTIRHDANPLETLKKVHKRVEEINQNLPEKNGFRLQIEPFYDRAPVIEETIQTLNSALRDACLITALVILILMKSLAAGILVAMVLPLGILATYTGMYFLGIEANIVALSGIAIAIGVMADVGIVLVESIAKQMKTQNDPVKAAIQGSSSVTLPLMIAVSTTLLSFLPVFFLTGAEGKLFRPLAATKTLTILLALLTVILILPSLARFALHPRFDKWNQIFVWPMVVFLGVLLSLAWSPAGENAGILNNFLHTALSVGGLLLILSLFEKSYTKLLSLFLEFKLLFLIPAGMIVISGFVFWFGAGSLLSSFPESLQSSSLAQWLIKKVPARGTEFMPVLKEGSFLYMPTTMPHASSEFIHNVLSTLDLAIASIPEVEVAAGKAGRADTALDPAPLSMIETIVKIKPEFSVEPDGNRIRNWRDSILTERDIWDEIVNAAQIPGLTSAPRLQPIEGRIVMLQSGIRASMAVRLRGSDLLQMESLGMSIAEILQATEGIRASSVFADRAVGKAYLEIHWKREALALIGLRVEDAQNLWATALAGRKVSEVIRGRERFDITLRYGKLFRNTPQDLEIMPIVLPDGKSIRLSEIADISIRKGPMEIKGENSRLVSYVLFDREKHLSDGEAVTMASKAIQSHIQAGSLKIPAHISWDFAGGYENQIRANQRLLVIIPIALLIIFIVLSLMFGSMIQTLILFSSVLVAFSGGFFMLYLLNINLSVAVWVGFLALFGIATDDGVLISSYLKEEWQKNRPKTIEEIRFSVLEAGKRRIRACLMTTATTLLALIPIFASTGRGSEIMQPMAIPIFGGMSIALITLFMVPILFCLLEEWKSTLKGASNA